jgi:hypothetical protein
VPELKGVVVMKNFMCFLFVAAFGALVGFTEFADATHQLSVANSEVSGQPADAKDYSLGSNSLIGEVVAVQGDRLSLKDSSGQLVQVRVADQVLLNDVNKGDFIRVGFAEDGQTAATVHKETEDK